MTSECVTRCAPFRRCNREKDNGGAWSGSLVDLDQRWLKFRNKGQEIGFLQHRTSSLAMNLYYCALVMCAASVFSLAFVFIIAPIPGSPKTGHIDAFWQDIVTRASMFTIALASSVVVIARTSGLIGRIGLVKLEVIAVSLVLLVMVLTVFSDWYYLARLSGHDPYKLWGLDPCKIKTDSEMLLKLSVLTVASHFTLPIRWFMLVIIEVLCALLYVVCIVVGSSESRPLWNVIFLSVFILLTARGKRQLELAERITFSCLMSEKSLRAQAEFQLSRLQDTTRKEDADDNSSAAATTITDRIFKGPGKASELDPHWLETWKQIGKREQWLIDQNEIKLHADKHLGEGGFGVVVAASYHGSRAAIKIPLRRSDIGGMLDMGEELRILRKLRHPNIVLFHGACVDFSRGDTILVLEMVNGKRLDIFMNLDTGKDGPDAPSRCQLLLGVCTALMYLHTRQPSILHGDLKSGNIMVEKRGNGPHPKLLDFGLAKVLTRKARTRGGTHRWAAPEVFARHLTENRPHLGGDVFSFGRLIFYVVTGKKPLAELADRIVEAAARKGEVLMPSWPSSGSPLLQWCQPIVEASSRVDPGARPSMQDVFDNLVQWPTCQELAGALIVTSSSNFWDNVEEVRLIASKQKKLRSGGRHAKIAKMKGLQSAEEISLAAVPEDEAMGSGKTEPFSTVGAIDTNFPSPLGAIDTNSPSQRSSNSFYKGFAETPEQTLHTTLVECMIHWNFSLPSPSCCEYHSAMAYLSRITKQMRNRGCMANDRFEMLKRVTAHEQYVQCPSCGIIVVVPRPASEDFDCYMCDYQGSPRCRSDDVPALHSL